MLPTQTPVPAAAAAAAEAAVAAAAAAAAEAAAAAAAEVSQVFPQALPKCTLPGDSSSGEGSGGPGRTRSTAPANTGAVHTVCGAHAPSVVVVGVWVQVPLQAALQGWQRGKEGEGGEPVGGEGKGEDKSRSYLDVGTAGGGASVGGGDNADDPAALSLLAMACNSYLHTRVRVVEAGSEKGGGSGSGAVDGAVAAPGMELRFVEVWCVRMCVCVCVCVCVCARVFLFGGGGG